MAAADQAPRRVLSFDIGVRHLAYAQVVLRAGEPEGQPDGALLLLPFEVERWRTLDVHEHLPATANPKKPSADDVVAAVVALLDAEFMQTDGEGGPEQRLYDYVLLENQPSCKNPVMKSVQVAIHAFFATWRHYTGGGAVGVVRPVSASRKLCAAVRPATESATPTAQASASASQAYRSRKCASVARCAELLAGQPRLQAVLASARKKDDLADALLQALWFTQAFPCAERRPGPTGPR
jgi:hypothetical protein